MKTPAVSTKRLSMTRNGRVRYELKTPWRNYTILFITLSMSAGLVFIAGQIREKKT